MNGKYVTKLHAILPGVIAETGNWSARLGLETLELMISMLLMASYRFNIAVK